MKTRSHNPYKNSDIENLESYVKQLNSIIKENNRELLPILQRTQDIFAFLPKNALHYLSENLGISMVKIYGVITFYNRFRLQPVGKYIVKVCCGTACHVAGAENLTLSISGELDIPEGDTTPDKMFTLESVACVGCCNLAPVVLVNKETHAYVSIDDAIKQIRKLKSP